MEVDKQGVKGGFLQLFDWNGKSRKKLFSSKSDLPESNYHGSVIARHQLALEKDYPLNATSENDYPYASLANGDSEMGTKAPGVVARLMGLDSLPTSNVNEPCFNPFTDSLTFRDSSYLMAAPAFHSEHDIVIFESVRNKLDGSSRNPLDLRLQKVQNRPPERFQREVLPPKSAKPISVSHNRLLSPIKSPGFIPPKNAAYIIEAAAKIIEQSPRPTSKRNFSSLGSPSVRFRIRDLKEKMESAQRSSRSADASRKVKDENSKNIKKQLNVWGKDRVEDNYIYKGSEETKRESSQRIKAREKPVSLAVQAKSNIQKRYVLTSSVARGYEKQKEHSGCLPRDLPYPQKKVEKQSSSRRPSEVLRLNNQKQNRALAKDDDLEPSCSQPKDRLESNFSGNYINGRTKRTVNKIVVNDVETSRKTNFMAADPGKEVSLSRAKTTSKRSLPVNGNTHSSGGVAQKAMVMKEGKPVKCNVAFEDDSKWDVIGNHQSSLDVVSFTFTSPIKKSVRSNSSGGIMEATGLSPPNYDPRICESDSITSAASSSGFNVIGGDALSVLLEQKLKEFSSKIEVSQKDMSGSASLSISAKNYGNMSPTVNVVESRHMDNKACKSNLEALDASDSNPADNLWLQHEKASKGLQYIQGVGDSHNIQKFIHSQVSTSLLSQPSLSGASCDSFNVDQSSSNEGPTTYLLLDSCDGRNCRSTRNPHLTEGDQEISDTASSLSVGTTSETFSSSLYLADTKHSSNWELQYIREILSHAELLSEEFSLGQAHKIVAPDLFFQLENQKMESYKVMEENVLERKLLFDCVCECLETRCCQLLGGGWQYWSKQMTILHRRQWLADDLYREISSWTNVDELMVDELVDKDMSSKSGKWIEFEVEAFEGGVEIGNRILTCLVDELIDDFLL